jgi:transposase
MQEAASSEAAKARIANVAPYFGLVPKVSESGSSSDHGKITKAGNKMTRTYLVSSATILLQARTRDCAIRRWAMTVAERRGQSKARIALAKKLAIVMLAMWKSGQAFNPDGRKP